MLKCDECGEEAQFVMYFGTKRYCYSCFAKMKEQQLIEYDAGISRMTRRVKNEYRRGMKPEEIADALRIPLQEVNDRLNEKFERKTGEGL